MTHPPARPWWPHVRAALVAAHVLAVGVAALPAPEGGMNRAAWADPTVQAELDAWAGRLRSLGLPVERAALEDHLWVVGRTWTQARAALLRPLRPYYRGAGTNQSWRMFVAPHRFPARLVLSVREDGAWRDVYVERDPQRRWMGRQLDHDRFRSAIFRYSWPGYGRAWAELGQWLALRAARDFPRASHLRLRFARQRSPSPAEVRAGVEPPVRFLRAQEVELAPLRAGDG